MFVAGRYRAPGRQQSIAVERRQINSRDLFWAHVTTFGALWGALEITLGSFLHALRVPFGGVLLAAMGAALLVAQRQLLPTRGASLATGFVAALCKSISPGGIILGPMMGILTEAALVEVALLPAPRSPVSAAAGGALCALWSFGQKLFTQYILYGSKLIDLYLALLGKARIWMKLSVAQGYWVLGTALGVVCLIGIAGSLVGYRMGRDAGRLLAESEAA